MISTNTHKSQTMFSSLRDQVAMLLAFLIVACCIPDASAGHPPAKILKRYKINLRHLERAKYATIQRIEYAVDRKIEKRIRQNFSAAVQERTEAQAANIYPIYELGQEIHVTVSGRPVQGPITWIGDTHVKVNSLKVSIRDLPETAFNQQLADRLRRDYVQKAFFEKKIKFERKMKRTHDKQLIAALRKAGYVKFKGEWLTTKHVVKLWKDGKFPEQSDQQEKVEDPDEFDEFDEFDDFGDFNEFDDFDDF